MSGALLAPIPAAQSAPARWEQLAPIPDAEGFAAPFAGVSGGALIVAGGANVVGEKFGTAFEKRWHDPVFVLAEPQAQWQRVGQLARPLGYGVSATWRDGVVCAGGSDAQRHYAECFILKWVGGKLTVAPLPSLPRSCANACGALLGDTLYIAGGIETPTATAALRTFWALDLAAPQPAWRELEPCPGPARMLAVAGTDGTSFYFFSGAALTAGPDGKPVREFLRDAWRFTPGRGWQRLADLPRAAVAAPSPAPWLGERLHVFTGDDGANVTFQPLEKHPGFPRDALAYDPAHDVWSVVADGVPFSRATVPTVPWRGRIVIPNGEVRPRVRTNEVHALDAP